MLKWYSYFYLFFAFTYLLGRISLTTHYTIGQENLRVIKNRVLPQNILREADIALQNDKQTVADIRRISAADLQFEAADVKEKKFLFVTILFITTPYSGHYIDPPPLYC